MNVLTVIAGLTGAVITFAILAALTKKAQDYLTRCRELDQTPPPLQEETAEPQEPPEDPASQPKRATWWWHRLLSREAMVGLLLLSVELPILIVNSYLIAISMEVIFPNSPLLLGEIKLWGWWERSITVFDLYGVLISLAQMVTASVCHLTGDNKRSLVWLSSMCGLLSLIAFEISLACRRGFLLEGEINAYLSSLLAMGIATTEVAAGILIIDYFLVSFLLTLFWTLTAPVWVMVDWAKKRKPRNRQPRRPRSGNAVLRALATPLVAVDQAIMEPLRSLDNEAAKLWSQAIAKFQKGENNHANTRVSSQRKDEAGGSGSDREPPGMRH
jgi:hypothetical protein